MTFTTPVTFSEYKVLQTILDQLQDIVQRESKRPQGYEQLHPSMLALVEEELIPLLYNELNYEPTDDELCSASDSAPMSAAEVHNIAWVQHQAMHS